MSNLRANVVLLDRFRLTVPRGRAKIRPHVQECIGLRSPVEVWRKCALHEHTCPICL